MLFVAGLSILIDLFEPDKLRSLGASARERASAARSARAERRKVRERIYARQGLFNSFVEPLPWRYLPGGRRSRLTSKPHRYTPWKEEITREDYLSFWRRVHDRLPSLHRKCREDHGGACPHQETYILEQVDAFMKRRVGATAFELLQTRHDNVYMGLRLRWVPIPFLIASTWAAFGGADTAIKNVLQIGFWTVFCVAGFFFFVMVFPGLLPSILWSVAGGFLNWSGSQLDRKRPLHPFRIAAVVLFIAGNMIKLVVGN